LSRDHLKITQNKTYLTSQPPAMIPAIESMYQVPGNSEIP